MTAATGKGANRAHGARAQPTNPLRTADAPPGVERISVTLIPKVFEALQRLQARTNMSRTDLVNRAVTLLDFFEAQRDSDRDILIRDNSTQEIHSVMLQ